MPRFSRGFTLLEVIIALAVAVLGIAAVAKATGSAATVAEETRERTLAVWVAGNRLSELKINRTWPATGTEQAERVMGGRTWYLTQTVDGTDNPAVRKVSIEVYTDEQRSSREFQLYGYVARYRPPDRPAPEDDGSGIQDEGGQPEAAEMPLPGEEQPVEENGTQPPASEGSGNT